MGKRIRLVVDVEALGRKGGLATAANRTRAERKAAATAAINARWEKYYKAHPEKLKEKLERKARKRRGDSRRARADTQKDAK
jgi:hypothetical protein